MAYKLREISWAKFDEIRKNIDTVIIPSGAVEGYGPHMPLGSDIIAAEEIAFRVAEKTGAIIGPSIEVGDSRSQRTFPGCMITEQEHFKAYTRDICECLRKWGMKKFLFITGHSGNVPLISCICKEYRDKYTDIKTAQVDWWRFTQRNDADTLENKGYLAHGHASECGTSVMLYLKPELVDMNLAVKNELDDKYVNSFTDIIQYIHTRKKTTSGVIGDATVATREKGEKIVNACVNRIVDYIEKEFNS